MLKNSLELLSIIESSGFKAYLIGGCVRDYILGKQFLDIDICTSATPHDIKKIFSDNLVTSDTYGSVVLVYNGFKFEITTFRCEEKYSDGRRPDSYTYVTDLETDLKRRDFTINTICMNKNKKIIDLYNGIDDIKQKLIRTVGCADDKFYEDALRMLRAIRFATVLDFDISLVKKSIIKNLERIELISYERRRGELDKIFMSNNKELGVKLLVETGMSKYLGLDNITDIVLVDDIIGIWAQIRNFSYPFKKHEKKIMNLIIEILDNNISVMNNFALYKYGLYVCMLVTKIRGEDVDNLNNIYNNLPLVSFDMLEITTDEICSTLNIKKDKRLKLIYDNIVNEILSLKLANNNKAIITYLKNSSNMLK